MSVYYQAGRSNEAIAAAGRALSLGGLNPETVSKAALVIYISGRWNEGVTLANRALAKAGVYKPVGASLVMMLDTYRRGDLKLAVRRVDEAARPDPVATLVKLAALRRLNATDELADALSKARLQYKDFDRMLMSVANSGRYEKSLAASLGNPLIEIARDVRWSTGSTAVASH